MVLFEEVEGANAALEGMEPPKMARMEASEACIFSCIFSLSAMNEGRAGHLKASF
jgi:hypothetical protein